MIRALTEDHEAIKVFVEVGQPEETAAAEAAPELVATAS